MTTINIDVARKVLSTVDAGLVNGMGNPIPGLMCVEAAVCYALGLPHGDDPGCVSPALRRLKIRLNDLTWTSNVARANGLRRLALAQLGSAGVLDDTEFSRRVASLAWKTQLPKALLAVAALFRDGTATKEKLLNAADICRRDEPNYEARCKLRGIASDIRSAAAAADADAVAAADAVAVAVAVAAAAADAVAAADAAADADKQKFWEAYWRHRDLGSKQRDAAIAEFCEGVVQILIEMKAPGCEWLALTESVQS